MLVIQNTEHFRIEQPCIVTIGTFDGVHLGHKKILWRLNEFKQQTGLKTVVFTFDPHPRKVLFPEQGDLKLLTTTAEKLDLLEQCGVDVTVVYPFSRLFSQLNSEDYINNILVRQLNVKRLVIGYDHKFGKKRLGDINTLRQFAAELNFEVEEIAAKDVDNITISSSKIRKALEEGKLELASNYLGYNFTLQASVVKGKQLGRTLGFATANLETEVSEKIVPKMGVYFTEVLLDGVKHYGMMSIGTNPTTDIDARIKMEVHIFNFNEDIYSKNLTIRFIKRLRDERKFEGLSELKEALHQDREECMQLIPL